MPDQIIRASSFPAVSLILSFRLASPFAKLAQPVQPVAPGKTAGATETARERVSRLPPTNPENVRAERALAAACRCARAYAPHAGCAFDEHVLRAPAAAMLPPAVRPPPETQNRGAARRRLPRAKRTPGLRSCRSRSSG